MGSQSWFNVRQRLFTYKDGALYQELDKKWDGSTFVNDIRDTYTYTTLTRVARKDENPKSVPQNFRLTNYPNPFNPETTIQFNLPQNLAGNLRRPRQSGDVAYRCRRFFGGPPLHPVGRHESARPIRRLRRLFLPPADERLYSKRNMHPASMTLFYMLTGPAQVRWAWLSLTSLPLISTARLVLVFLIW